MGVPRSPGSVLAYTEGTQSLYTGALDSVAQAWGQGEVSIRKLQEVWQEVSVAHLSGEEAEVQERPTRSVQSLGHKPIPLSVSASCLPAATEPLCPRWWLELKK